MVTEIHGFILCPCISVTLSPDVHISVTNMSLLISLIICSTSALNFPVLNLDGQTSGGPIAVSMSPNGQTPFYHFGGGYGVPQSPTFTGQFQGGSGGNHFVQVAVTAPSVFPMQYQLQQGQP